MREFASELRAHREATGMSLEDLFDRTRINPEYLRAIETGNYDILPDIYVRLFIKKYAQEVGLDVDETLDKYDKIKPYLESGQFVARPPRDRSLPFGRVLAILCVLALVIASIFLMQDSTSPPEVVTESPMPGNVNQSTTSAPDTSKAPEVVILPEAAAGHAAAAKPESLSAPPREPDDTGNALRGDRVVSSYSLPQQYSGIWEDEIILSARALVDTRMSVFSDGDSTFEDRLLSGTSRKWTARDRFRVEIEDPAAVSLSLQDKPVTLPTKHGRKHRLFISRSTIWVEEIESVAPPPVR